MLVFVLGIDPFMAHIMIIPWHKLEAKEKAEVNAYQTRVEGYITYREFRLAVLSGARIEGVPILNLHFITHQLPPTENNQRQLRLNAITQKGWTEAIIKNACV